MVKHAKSFYLSYAPTEMEKETFVLFCLYFFCIELRPRELFLRNKNRKIQMKHRNHDYFRTIFNWIMAELHWKTSSCHFTYWFPFQRQMHIVHKCDGEKIKQCRWKIQCTFVFASHIILPEFHFTNESCCTIAIAVAVVVAVMVDPIILSVYASQLTVKCVMDWHPLVHVPQDLILSDKSIWRKETASTNMQFYELPHCTCKWNRMFIKLKLKLKLKIQNFYIVTCLLAFRYK